MTNANETAICLDRYADKEEAAVARRLVRKALEAGYTISVDDGEDVTVARSTDRKAILEALATTGADTLIIRDATGARLGSLYLVYQNGPGEELIADHSDNEAMEALYRAANKES
ncbi:hypothetical protein LAV_00213 [Sphingobium phage Lacusarx]|uniref:Uncharacterized protein n=1 Tax=Sphingobium phage Lacusarx TaxID=1980139 RepID=A0A1W6DXE6_9CAUD|nr:hypothetical protein FDH44_gp090 [Sphingobium phage Lacusarx]ARK07588.1 hypothetical protein LAV_00213 [Sphingobium phage Lacusarx]